MMNDILVVALTFNNNSNNNNIIKKKCKTFFMQIFFLYIHYYTYKGKTFNNVIIYHLCDIQHMYGHN